jgi:hypothetical protein
MCLGGGVILVKGLEMSEERFLGCRFGCLVGENKNLAMAVYLVRDFELFYY